MAKFEDTVAKAKEYLDIAGKKTGEFIDLQKLKINASTVRNSIAKDFESVGRMYYDGLKKETDNSDAIKAVVADIDGKYEELAEIESKIADAKGGNICPDCGTQDPDDSYYCRRCGKKL